MNIGMKTTGMLLNELVTTSLKRQHLGNKPEFIQREEQISKELINRGLAGPNMVDGQYVPTEKYESIRELFEALLDTLIEMWDAVEETKKLRDIEEKNNEDWESLGKWADISYKLNAERAEYIQRIDKILGQEKFTFLEKSYK